METRLGYCCINLNLRKTTMVNRTCRKATFHQKALRLLQDAFDAMLPEVLAALEKGSKDASGGGISAMFKGLFG